MRYETNEKRRGQPDSATYRLARGLGYFSIVLGLMEVIAGGWLARQLGLQGHEMLVRIYGVREIATGIAILFSTNDPTVWIWVRVAGDALDIGTVLLGFSQNPVNVCIALVALVGVTILDIYCAVKLSSESREPLAPLHDYSDRSGLGASGQTLQSTGASEGNLGGTQ